MLVAFGFFLDQEKEIDWLPRIENGMRNAAAIQGLAYGLVLLLVLIFGNFLPASQRGAFFGAAILGAVVFMAVEALSHILDAQNAMRDSARAGGLGAFLYLEVLDASFSFDGVIGAFALTQNLFIIAIGLGMGAMYVRSATIMLVEKGTLSEYRFLEHGAFYAILVLAIIMFLQPLVHVPEVVTGLIGVALIGLALASSIRWNRVNEVPDTEPETA